VAIVNYHIFCLHNQTAAAASLSDVCMVLCVFECCTHLCSVVVLCFLKLQFLVGLLKKFSTVDSSLLNYFIVFYCRAVASVAMKCSQKRIFLFVVKCRGIIIIIICLFRSTDTV